ncbi:MAG: hypothetical protein HYX87_06995 [Chloroflexi bacterium]|nr:hypothetical protein [Chloroflexota bacterium]
MSRLHRSACLVSIALITVLVLELVPAAAMASTVQALSPVAGRAGKTVSAFLAGLHRRDASAPGGGLQPVPLSDAVVARIGTEGGTITSADGRITVSLPSGALSEAAEVSFTPLQKDAWGVDGKRVVDMFELKATASASKVAITRFPKDIDISIRLSRDYMRQELAGLDVNSLSLYYLNESSGQWQEVASTSSNDKGQPVLSARTNHFSIFGSQAYPMISGPGQVLGFDSDLHTGAATASIPIEVPPGPGGFAPKLSLNYNSGSVDEMKNKRDVSSWVGMGWSLKLPSMSYNPEIDKYYLDFNGTYELVQYGTYFHTKPESYYAIKNGGIQWEVWDTDGTYYYIGGGRYYANADGFGGYDPIYYRWDTTLIRDTHGNEISIAYETDIVTDVAKYDIVSAYPVDIKYGKNVNVTGSINRFNVHFQTGTDGTRNSTWGWIRADNPGPPEAWARIRENKRLEAIEVRQDSDGNGTFETLVRKYALTYNTTPWGTTPPYPAGKMTLTSFQQYGADGTSTLPAMSFSYVTPTTLLYRPVTWNTNTNPGNPAIFNWPHLSQITNGYGATVNFAYATKPALPADPPQNVDGLRPQQNIWHRAVVTQRSVNPGIDPTQTLTYSYTGDPQYWVRYAGDHWYDEYRGFSQTRMTDADGNYSDHWYYTTGTAPDGKDGEKLTGREYKTEWRDSSGTLLKRRNNNWEWSWSGYRGMSSGLDQRVDLTWAQETMGSKVSRTEYAYDTNGNLTREFRNGDTGTASDDSTIFRVFYPNTTNTNILRKPARERTYTGNKASDDGAGIKSETINYYDGHNTDYTVVPTRGDLTRISRAITVGSSYADTYYTHDDYGNKLTETDPNANVRSWTYDSTYHNLPVTETYPQVGTLIMQESATWDYGAGRILSWTDVNNQTTSYEYDTFKRQTKVIKPGDSSGSPSTTYNYNSWGALNQQNLETVVKVSGTENRWSRQYFDGLGRVVQVQSEGETEGGTTYTIIDKTTSYSNRAQVDKEYVSQKLDSTTVSNYMAPEAGWKYAAYTYDGMGRVLNQTGSDGTTVSHGYTDWQETVTNQKGYKKSYTSDGFGRLSKVEEYDDAVPAIVYATTQYSYDLLGNLVGVTDNAGNVTSLTYDALSRKTSMTDPDMGTWSYQYDANGNLTSQTNAKGQTITFGYDALNRLKAKLLLGEPLATYYYDDTTGGNYGKGRRTGMFSGQVATDSRGYIYDARGRLVQERLDFYASPVGTFATSYAYDGMDRVTSVTYPTGEVVTQTFDGGGSPYSLSGSLVGSIVTKTLYNQLGQITLIDLGNGLSTLFKYHGLDSVEGTDPMSYWGKPYSIKTYKVSDGSNVRQWQKYWWDAGGNLSSRKDEQALETESFSYDFLDRLTGVSGPYAESYTYNAIGNMTSKDGVSYSYGTRPHAVTGVGSYVLGYDANGNMTSRQNATGTQTLVFDSENRLSSVAGEGYSAWFSYDADGKRIKKVISGAPTVYINRYYEKNTATGEETSYYYLGDRLVALKKGTVLEYVHQDHLGSSSVSTYSDMSQKSILKYYPLGAARSTVGTLGTDKQFTGERLDSTGLYFYNARYYDPEIGRFVSPDTVVPDLPNPQAFNRYSYVLNNPLKYIDSDGHFPFLAVIAVTLIVANYASTAYDAYEFATTPSVGNFAWLALGFVDPTPGGAKVAKQMGERVFRSVANPKDLGLREFTEGNFRKALKRLTDKSFTAAEKEAHHVLPKEFEDGFRKAGIENINDPRFGSWVDPGEHAHWSSKYNDEWQRFFDELKGKKTSEEDILKYAEELSNKYNFDVNFKAP